MRGLFPDHVLAPRPGRVAVREIARPHQLPLAHQVRELERRVVVLEGERDVLAEIFRRQAREVLALHPVAVPLVGVVHAVGEVRRPARVGLDADHPEPGMPLEHAGEDQHAHDVLAAADDRQKSIELGPARPGERIVAGGREDMERQRQFERDRRLPERIEGRVVIVLLAGIARHHHALETHCLDRLEVGDAFLDRADRGLAQAHEAPGVMAAILLEPAVVGVEAGLFVVEVGVIADQHADGRIDQFGADAVAILVGQPHFRVPSALVQIVEPGAADPDVFRRDAGRGNEAERHRRLHAVDHERVAHFLQADDLGRPLAKGRVDIVAVAVGRLRDVRIGGNRAPVHAFPPRFGQMVGMRRVRRQAPRTRSAPAVEPPAPLWHIRALRCRSSVVEHSLGKGEVDSSILSGSTSFPPVSDHRSGRVSLA